MNQKLGKQNRLPQQPKKKMPFVRALLMFGVALCFSVLIFTFSIFPITAPLMVGVGAGITTEQYTGSETAGNIVGWLAGTFTGVAEIVSGVGVGMLSFIGEFLADSLTFFGWIIFYFWLIISGVSFIGTSSATKRFAITAVATIVGLIPFLNIIPTLLIGVVLIIMNIRKEDHIAYSKYKDKLKKYNAQKKNLLAQRAMSQ